MNLTLDTCQIILGVLMVILIVLISIDYLIHKKRVVKITRKERLILDLIEDEDEIPVVKHKSVRRKAITKCKYIKRFV